MRPSICKPPRAAMSPPPRKVTPAALHQRILFTPSSPPSTQILHSPAHETLDPLILDFIALTLRAYVTPWYNGGISRDPDKAFLGAVTSILVHVIQALEVRLSALDWTELLVADIPAVLAQHYRDWDVAVEKAQTGGAHNLNPEQLFHRLQPHLAIRLITPIELSPSEAEQARPEVDKLYLRTLVDHLLKLLLPPADYRADTERAIVREVLVGVVFGSVFNRVAQPWFLHGIIAKQLEAREGARKEAESSQSAAPSYSSSLDKLIASLYSLPSIAAVTWSTFTALSRLATLTAVPPHYSSQPPLHTGLLSLIVAILPSSTFLTQIIHYLSLPFTFFASFIDALFFHFVTTRVATARTVEVVLEGAMIGMFPNDGWPAPKEDDPDEEGQEDLRLRCEVAVARALPAALPSLVAIDPPIPDEDPHLTLSRYLLRPLSSHVANVHLLVLIVDLMVSKVFPELLAQAED
ncbi:hypothetical protein JCM11251_007462 [Rhodosporidiobolus azoricus]